MKLQDKICFTKDSETNEKISMSKSVEIVNRVLTVMNLSTMITKPNSDDIYGTLIDAVQDKIYGVSQAAYTSIETQDILEFLGKHNTIINIFGEDFISNYIRNEKIILMLNSIVTVSRCIGCCHVDTHEMKVYPTSSDYSMGNVLDHMTIGRNNIAEYIIFTNGVELIDYETISEYGMPLFLVTKSDSVIQLI
jgi:hypothetical protein